MAQRKKENPFDEQSTNKNSGKEKKVVPKIDFNSLTYEEKIKHVKEKFNEGLTSEELDFYNTEVLKEEKITGKSSRYKQAPKPTTNKNKREKPNKEIKDFSELAKIEGQFPKGEEFENTLNTLQNSEQAGLKKAEELGGGEATEELQQTLDEKVNEPTAQIVEETEDKIIEAIQEVKTPKTVEKPLTKQELLDKVNGLKEESAGITREIEQLEQEKKELKEKKQNNPKEDPAEEQIKALESRLNATEGNLTKEEDKVKQEYQNALDSIKKDKNDWLAFTVNGIIVGKTKQEVIDKINTKYKNTDYDPKKEAEEALKRIHKDIDESADIFNKKIETNQTAQELSDLLDKEDKIKQEYFELNEKINQGNATEEERARFEELILERSFIENEKTRLTEKLVGKTETEEVVKIEAKNEEVLEKIEEKQKTKKEGWFSRSKESVSNAFKKSLDWWNKDYSERSNKEKFAKTMLSGGFIGAGVFLTALGVDAGSKAIDFIPDSNLLTQNDSLVGKITSRVFGAGFASALAIKFSGNIAKGVEGFRNLSKAQKVAAVSALGIAGVGGFMYFAAAGTLATAGIALGNATIATGARFGVDKFVFNKKIDSKKETIKTKEEQIAEIKKQIEEEENKEEKTLDIHALVENMDSIQKDIDKLNNELRKIKTFQSLTRGAISIAGGLGTMAVMNASKVNWRELLEDKDSTKTETTPIVERPKPEEIKPIPNPTPENKINIPKEAIIDGKERVGITYAFRDQLIADKNLAAELGIDHDKLNDAKYVAKEMKNLAIKLGYMDNEGHEIRISEDGNNKIAYILNVNEDGKAEVSEVNTKTGEIIETHCEGDSFEGKNYNKEYETFEDKKYSYTKTDENILQDESKTYPAPERITNPGEVTTIGENVSDNEVKPDSLSQDEIKAPERVSNIDKYTYGNIEESPIWENTKSKQILDFLNTHSAKSTVEETKIFNYLQAEYREALGKDANLRDYLLENQEKLTVEEGKELFYKINNRGYRVEVLAENVSDNEVKTGDIIEKIKGDQELQEINKVAEKFDYEVTAENLKEVKKIGNQNINTLFEENKDAWTKIKDVGAAKYMKAGSDGDLNNYLNKLKSLTGLKPKNGVFGIGLGKKEQIDDYINRCLLEAQKKGILSKVILEKPEEIDISKMKPASQ